MHKIVAGVANRSYGIQVAKMAGMPKSVVERAEEVLSGLESHNETLCADIAPVEKKAENKKGERKEAKVSEPNAGKTQLNLFG